MINLRVRTLDARTFDFCVANEITIREFKDKIWEKSGIPIPLQRILFGGRLLPDDQNLRDFDVEGKVLHVAERPPPESLSQSSRRSRNGQRPGVPLLDMALCDMAVGSMHRLDSGHVSSAYDASSSFCMNRINVALYMLDCADNIAAFIEDPSRTLYRPNQTLDIMECGRLSKAVVLFENVESMPAERNGGDVTESIGGSVTQVNATSTAPSADGMVSIEDIGSGSDDLPNNNDFDNMPASTSNAAIARPASTAATAATASTSTTGASGNEAENMRTSPLVLANVIDRQRAVQSRLEPFIQQYYELLRNEPIFNEDNPDERVNAQRVYDSVSKAIHYMSHAQHAISELMLDLSVPAPRHLSCRPILDDGSGNVSNNYTNNVNSANCPRPEQHYVDTGEEQESRNPAIDDSDVRQSLFGLTTFWDDLLNIARTSNLRLQLLHFMSEHLFRGLDLSYINITPATDRAVDWFNHLLDDMPEFEQPSDYDARRSVLALLLRSVPGIIYTCLNESHGALVYKRLITRKLNVLLRRLYCILYECLGETNSELFWSHLVGLVKEHMNEVFHDEAFEFLTEHISHIVPMLTDDDIMDALQFAIRRSSYESTSPPSSDINDTISISDLPSLAYIPWERMDFDENELRQNQGTQGSNSNAAIDNEEANNLENDSDDDFDAVLKFLESLCVTYSISPEAPSSSTSAHDGGNVDATAEANVVIPATDDSGAVSANQSSNTESYDHSLYDVD